MKETLNKDRTDHRAVQDRLVSLQNELKRGVGRDRQDAIRAEIGRLEQLNKSIAERRYKDLGAKGPGKNQAGSINFEKDPEFLKFKDSLPDNMK